MGRVLGPRRGSLRYGTITEPAETAHFTTPETIAALIVEMGGNNQNVDLIAVLYSEYFEAAWNAALDSGCKHDEGRALAILADLHVLAAETDALHHPTGCVCGCDNQFPAHQPGVGDQRLDRWIADSQSRGQVALDGVEQGALACATENLAHWGQSDSDR
ncbi:hypothetical protein T492DRAFT_1140024 [Pavlovales sp. CCMP2436]|nr:hypothetical protein T492DRAFT_1140024 [Pavlovales sp. CCMP2436]